MGEMVVESRQDRRVNGWTDSEWSDIADVFAHYGAIGGAQSFEAFVTDRGDPWVAFFDNLGDTVAVIAKLPGRIVVTAGPGQQQVLWDGPSLAGYVARVRGSSVVTEVRQA